MSSAASATSNAPSPASTCPGAGVLPDLESLPIPHDVPVAVIPGTNASEPDMVACCSPNAVHVVEGCYLYCQAPPANPDLSSFGNCLTVNHRDLNKSRILGFSNDAAPGGHTSPSMTMAQLGVWALLVSGVSSMVFSA
ncbi:uncharacterized protein SPSK_03711 [Sporothrix schenckii 1099-18]|uniref:Uncharacterized protein n=1 Tax=Sporothrix schenckii 1099-18 TaxID=1397361 RepID=A0A0F2M041_SPOSC|nr:uncharacterized protein SPSK_03711 [Sporothrix schenckii 1099-18]KJR82130.1 hypothetical protein SPSK_03711 [Sporothrix schenckii 1099-18]